MQRFGWCGILAVVAVLAAPAAQAQQALSKGVAVTGLSGAINTTRDFTLVVPAGATQLSFALSGGSGDADLYVRRGAVASSSSNDCASEGSTNTESCSFVSPSAATYYVRVQAYRAYSGLSLLANYTAAAAPTVTLQNGVSVGNLGAAAGAWLRYRIDVPAGATNLAVRTSGGTGAVDLYVRAGAEPTSTVFDCRPLVVGNSETCSFAQPQTTSYYIGLYGFNAFAGVTLTASYSLPPPPPPGSGATWSGFSTYYVNAIGKTGVALRSALNEAAGRSHVRMSYANVWEALKYTDEDSANTANVILIYTGRSQAKTYNASVNSSDQDAWNREHVWPKSHGFPDEAQWAYTDIHHLRPADVSVNSTRGNKDFDWGGIGHWRGAGQPHRCRQLRAARRGEGRHRAHDVLHGDPLRGQRHHRGRQSGTGRQRRHQRQPDGQALCAGQLAPRRSGQRRRDPPPCAHRRAPGQSQSLRGLPELGRGDVRRRLPLRARCGSAACPRAAAVRRSGVARGLGMTRLARFSPGAPHMSIDETNPRPLLRWVLPLLLGLLGSAGQAAEPAKPEWDALDAALFEPLFNRCDLDRLDELVHPQLEFLHDQGGPQDRVAFERAVRQNICGGKGPKPIRRLAPGSLESHPMRRNDGELYALVQTGRHVFFLRHADGRETATSQARFVHTWWLEGGRWRLYRVLSFDHQAPSPQ